MHHLRAPGITEISVAVIKNSKPTANCAGNFQSLRIFSCVSRRNASVLRKRNCLPNSHLTAVQLNLLVWTVPLSPSSNPHEVNSPVKKQKQNKWHKLIKEGEVLRHVFIIINCPSAASSHVKCTGRVNRKKKEGKKNKRMKPQIFLGEI